MAARTVNMCFQVPSAPRNQDYRFSCSGSVWQCAIMDFHLPQPRCQVQGPTWTLCSGESHQNIPPFPKESLTWKPTTDLVSHNSVMIEIPGYLFCIFVMDCWGRRPILSFCQVVINTLTRRWLFSVWQFSCYRLYLALPASSVASCKDRLIQTSRICRWAFASFQNPLFKGVEWKKLTPQISGIPLPLGQVWGFSLLLHRLSLHCRALSYNCEVVVS